MTRGEIFIGLFLIAVGVAAWIISAGFVSETTMVRTLSPAFYPRLLAGVMIFCCLLLLVKAYRGRSIQAEVKWGQWYNVPMAIAAMFFQVFTFDELGCFPSAGITLVLLLRISRMPLWKSLAISVGFLVFMYIFFVSLLRLQFPMEFLPTLLGTG